MNREQANEAIVSCTLIRNLYENPSFKKYLNSTGKFIDLDTVLRVEIEACKVLIEYYFSYIKHLDEINAQEPI